MKSYYGGPIGTR